MISSVAMFLNGICNAFILGTYPIRPFLFIGLLFALYVGVWLAKRSPFRVEVAKRLSLVCVGSLLALFAVALALQIKTFHHYGIPQQGLATFVTKEEITNSRLAHNHFGKVVIGTLVQDRFHNSDTGAALLPFVLQPVALVMVCLFLCGLISLLTSVALRLAATGQSYALLPLYALVSFVVLEKSIDGGIVSDGAGLAICALVVLLVMPLRRFPSLLSLAAMGYGLLLYALYHFGWYVSATYVLYAFVHTGILFAAALTLYFFGIGDSKAALPLLVVSLAAVAAHMYISDHAQRMYLATTLGPGSYLTAYDNEWVPELPRIGTIGAMTVYDAGTLSPATVQAISEEQGLPLWYQFFASGESCDSLARHVSLTVLAPGALSSTHGALLASDYADIAGVNGWRRYALDLRYTACTARYLDVFAEAVREAGARQAIIYQNP